MHIVHTESSQGWGGQEIRIISEARGLQARGHRVTLLTPPGARIYTEAPRYGIETIALPIEEKRLPGLLALRHWLQAQRPDVINTHSSTDSWLAALANALSRRPIPIVRTRHISAPVKASAANRWLYGKAACRVVTTGESLRDELADKLHLSPEQVISVPTGVDLSRFSRQTALSRAEARQALNLPAAATVIGIAATLRSWKGHDDLLTAFALLAAEYPAVHLVIAGDGPQFARLSGVIAQSPYAGRIHLLGHREDVPNVLAALDLFALPSYANEGVPQAIIQAMAMEIPVVSTTIGAIGDAVLDGRTGLLIPPKDPRALLEALQRLVNDAEQRALFARNARQRAEQVFSLDRMLDAMETIFNTAVARAGR